MPSRKSFLNENELLAHLKQLGISDPDSVLAEINTSTKGIIKKHQRAEKKKNEEYENAKKLTKEELSSFGNLPKWVLDQAPNVRLVDGSKQTLIIPDGRKYQANNSLNDLSGGEWTYFTNSVINTNYMTSGENSFAHHIRKIHPSPKPPVLMRDIISFFTKQNEIVLDYFMGVGGTLLGASACGRRAIGIDLNPIYIDAYKRAAKELNLSEEVTVCDESIQFLASDKLQEILKGEEIGLILIDPPYGNMMSKKKTGADISVYGNTATPFSDSPKDLGNMPMCDFFDNLKKSVELASRHLKNKGYIVIFIKDLQPSKKAPNILHADIINSINSIPKIEYKGLKIWADQSAKLFPYGYPFAFVANQIHQYILVFQKK